MGALKIDGVCFLLVDMFFLVFTFCLFTFVLITVVARPDA